MRHHAKHYTTPCPSYLQSCKTHSIGRLRLSSTEVHEDIRRMLRVGRQHHVGQEHQLVPHAFTADIALSLRAGGGRTNRQQDRQGAETAGVELPGIAPHAG